MADDSWKALYKDLEDFFCDEWVNCDVCVMDAEQVMGNPTSIRVFIGCPIKEFVERRMALEDEGA